MQAMAHAEERISQLRLEMERTSHQVLLAAKPYFKTTDA